MKCSCSVALCFSVVSCSTPSMRERASVALTRKRWVPSRLVSSISASALACTPSCNSVQVLSVKNWRQAVRPGTKLAMPNIFCSAGLTLRKWPYMSSVNRPTGMAW